MQTSKPCHFATRLMGSKRSTQHWSEKVNSWLLCSVCSVKCPQPASWAQTEKCSEDNTYNRKLAMETKKKKIQKIFSESNLLLEIEMQLQPICKSGHLQPWPMGLDSSSMAYVCPLLSPVCSIWTTFINRSVTCSLCLHCKTSKFSCEYYDRKAIFILGMDVKGARYWGNGTSLILGVGNWGKGGRRE